MSNKSKQSNHLNSFITNSNNEYLLHTNNSKQKSSSASTKPSKSSSTKPDSSKSSLTSSSNSSSITSTPGSQDLTSVTSGSKSKSKKSSKDSSSKSKSKKSSRSKNIDSSSKSTSSESNKEKPKKNKKKKKKADKKGKNTSSSGSSGDNIVGKFTISSKKLSSDTSSDSSENTLSKKSFPSESSTDSSSNISSKSTTPTSDTSSDSASTDSSIILKNDKVKASKTTSTSLQNPPQNAESLVVPTNNTRPKNLPTSKSQETNKILPDLTSPLNYGDVIDETNNDILAILSDMYSHDYDDCNMDELLDDCIKYINPPDENKQPLICQHCSKRHKHKYSSNRRHYCINKQNSRWNQSEYKCKCYCKSEKSCNNDEMDVQCYNVPKGTNITIPIYPNKPNYQSNVATMPNYGYPHIAPPPPLPPYYYQMPAPNFSQMYNFCPPNQFRSPYSSRCRFRIPNPQCNFNHTNPNFNLNSSSNPNAMTDTLNINSDFDDFSDLNLNINNESRRDNDNSNDNFFRSLNKNRSNRVGSPMNWNEIMKYMK